MAESKDKRGVTLILWGTWLLGVSSRLAALFATRTSRWLIVIIFVMITLYVAYRQAWQPILATAPLPPGVAEAKPALNTDLLKNINDQRVERVESARIKFFVDGILRPPPAS